MATIYKVTSGSGIVDAGGFGQVQTLVNNYWKDPKLEKVFSIHFWKLQEMMAVTGEVALRVRDIGNTSLVRGEWIVFNEDMENFINDQRPVRAEDFYFVLDDSALIDLRAGIPILNLLQTVSIWGRLGLPAADSTDYLAFMQIASGGPIAPGSSGEGGATGFRIPPGQ